MKFKIISAVVLLLALLAAYFLAGDSDTTQRPASSDSSQGIRF